MQRGQRMFHVIDGVAGDKHEVEVGRIFQQLAVVVVEGAAKALLFFGGGSRGSDTATQRTVASSIASRLSMW